MTIQDLNGEPEISYPNFWEYKFIIQNGTDADELARGIVGEREHKVVFSNFSKDKKYASYNLSVLVNSNEERLEIFSALKHVSKYVL